MTPEAQRIAIAEACGWKPLKDGWFIPTALVSTYDPLSDPNAMHEAEKVIAYERQPHYLAFLKRVLIRSSEIGAAGEFEQTCATAAQRAEAFLKTIGKWDETV